MIYEEVINNMDNDELRNMCYKQKEYISRLQSWRYSYQRLYETSRQLVLDIEYERDSHDDFQKIGMELNSFEAAMNEKYDEYVPKPCFAGEVN